MSRRTARSVEQDSRGILDPGEFRQRVTLHRYPPAEPLAGLIEFLWAVSYDLPEGLVHEQQTITYPCVHLSIAHGQVGEDGRLRPLEATVTGVVRQLYTRRIAGTGWGVAAKSTPGGFGAFIPGPVADLTDQVLPVSQVLPLDEAALVAEVAAGGTESERVEVLQAALIRVLAAAEQADPDRKRGALEVAEVAALAEVDRSVRRLDELAAASGIGARTLQRMFAEFAGISPTWVLRRYRLLDAAETVRHGSPVVWAQVAADLGYSDQAHLVRDFRAAVGTTPAAYAAQQHAF
jgi:AraC-like DNA-binding protein